MNHLQVIILGFIEGLTEFLPVSSTAHLIITSYILGIKQTPFVTLFEVFIQSGAILAVLPLFFKSAKKNKRLFYILLSSFIPTAIIGLALHKIIKTIFFSSNILISFSLIIIGLVFILSEKFIFNKNIILKKEINNLDIKQAVLIGLAQSLAIIPGVSRAGIVMLSMMFLGYKRSESAKYSFLLAIPTILSASLFDLIKTNPSTVFTEQNGLFIIILGLITAFISAWIVVSWFIKYLQKNSLTPFGIYRIIIGILFLLWIIK